jgi:hypothetical protein
MTRRSLFRYLGIAAGCSLLDQLPALLPPPPSELLFPAGFIWTRFQAEPLNPEFDLRHEGIPLNIKVGDGRSFINWFSLSGHERIQGVIPGGLVLDGEPITVSAGCEISREPKPFVRTGPWLTLTFAGTVPDQRSNGVADYCRQIRV